MIYEGGERKGRGGESIRGRSRQDFSHIGQSGVRVVIHNLYWLCTLHGRGNCARLAKNLSESCVFLASILVLSHTSPSIATIDFPGKTRRHQNV